MALCHPFRVSNFAVTFFNSERTGLETGAGGGGQVVILPVIAGRELVSVRCLRFEIGSLGVLLPVTTAESIPVIETQARGGGGAG